MNIFPDWAQVTISNDTLTVSSGLTKGKASVDIHNLRLDRLYHVLVSTFHAATVVPVARKHHAVGFDAIIYGSINPLWQHILTKCRYERINSEAILLADDYVVVKNLTTGKSAVVEIKPASDAMDQLRGFLTYDGAADVLDLYVIKHGFDGLWHLLHHIHEKRYDYTHPRAYERLCTWLEEQNQLLFLKCDWIAVG